MKINLSLPLVAMAVIIGFAIYNNFDFGTLTFKNPWLAVVYIIAFAITMFFMFKGKGASAK
jgi:hypothetical protein